MTTDYIPQDFFGEDTTAHVDSTSTPSPPASPTNKMRKISITKIIMISMLVTVIIVVIYMFIKRAKGGVLESPTEVGPELPLSTEHDNIVANTSKAELSALLNNDFKQADTRPPEPPSVKNSLRDKYLSQFATLERITMAFIGTLPPHLANSIIAAKKTFENIKLDEASTPTETDSFMTYYGLDIANKVIEKKQPKEEVAPEVPLVPIIKKETVVEDNVKQNIVSFIEEISSNDSLPDTKKLATQLDNESDDEDDA